MTRDGHFENVILGSVDVDLDNMVIKYSVRIKHSITITITREHVSYPHKKRVS